LKAGVSHEGSSKKGEVPRGRERKGGGDWIPKRTNKKQKRVSVRAEKGDTGLMERRQKKKGKEGEDVRHHPVSPDGDVAIIVAHRGEGGEPRRMKSGKGGGL